VRILFGGKVFERLWEFIEPLFAGHELQAADKDRFPEVLPWAEVLITPPMKIDASLLDYGNNLRLLHQWGTGVEGIDLEACAARNIPVCNVPSRGTGNAESVAEFALLLMMLLARRWPRCQENLLKGRLHAPRGIALWQKRACVVGLGNLGECLVECLLGMGMTVRGVNRTLKEEFSHWGLENVYPLDRLEEAVEDCDFVLPALPLSPETFHLMNARIFRAMHSRAFLVNVARGDVVHPGDLEEALHKKIIAGYATDVFWKEPVDPEHPLLKLPNVIVTPHVAGVTDASNRGIASYVAANIHRLETGEPLLSRMDKPNTEQGGVVS